MRQPKLQTLSLSPAATVFAAAERMNQTLISQLDPAVWATNPPGGVRTIMATFTHIHNVRCKWVRLTAPHLGVPVNLKRTNCSRDQASVGLQESADRCTEMLEQAVGSGAGTVQEFRRDGWAPAWPVGLEMLAYMISHEAHHRGQICLLAHQLGSPLSIELTSGLWNWDKLWKTIGCSRGPGR